MRELVYAFLVSLGLIVFLFLVGAIYKPIHSGLPLSKIAPLLPASIIYSLSWAVPAGVLTSVILVYGRLSEDNEILGMKAGGVHPWVFVRPGVMLGVVASACLVYINGWLSPYSQRIKNAHITRLLKEDPLFPLKTGELTLRLGRYSIFVGAIEDHSLRDVVLYVTERGGQRTVIASSEAEYGYEEKEEAVGFMFKNGSMAVMKPGSSPVEWHNFDFKKMRFSIEFRDRLATKLKRSSRTTTWLYEEIHNPRISRRRVLRCKTEIQMRSSLAMSALSLAVMGMVLGLVIRRGSFVGSLIVAVVVLLALYGLQASVEQVCSSGSAPLVILWAPVGGVAFGGAVGLFTAVRA